ncbi:MAG: hypothetical protein COB69_08570 [Phycisphaera sp.]|nr:MAG: hypothetical protein COB69_08570 [Phycisphaera sp.]
MGDAPLMIGVSGLRGIVGESLTPEVVVRYAHAIGAWLDSQDPYQDCCDVVVAHDGREGHEMVYIATIAGLLACDWNVIPIGCAMTPTVGHFVQTNNDCAGGVVVTASHNPSEWNGMKCISAVHDDGTEASAPPVDKASEIVRRYYESDYDLAIIPFSDKSWSNHPANPTRAGIRVSGLSEPNSNATFNHARGVRNAIAVNGLNHRSLDKDIHDCDPCFRAVVDSVNASGSEGARLLFEELNISSVPLYGDGSGIFPHTPEPTKENLSGEGGLCDAVPGLKADVGFAQDPDGDRLAIVDENGAYIGEEYTFVLCAVSILEAMKEQKSRGREHAEDDAKTPLPILFLEMKRENDLKTPSASLCSAPPPSGTGEGKTEVVLCTNLSTSRMIDDVAAMYGARVVRTAVGEANVVEAMKKLMREGKDVVLGGEGNGGVIWPKVTYVRDSLGSMALVLSLMARTGKTVSELVADVPSYAIVKRKQPLAKKEDAEPAIARVADRYADERVDLQDGVRVDFDADKAWVHVRASNTEPILRLIAEAPTKERAEAVLDEVQKLVDAG